MVTVSFIGGENHWPAASHWQTLSHNAVMLRDYPYRDKLQHFKHAQENVCHHSNNQYRIWFVEQELCILPEHMTSSRVFGGVRIDQSFVFCVAFCRSLFDILSFFIFPIVLSVLSPFTASEYPFSIFSTSINLLT